jgi:hypothetical protein
VTKRPSIEAPRNGASRYSVPGCSASGTLNVQAVLAAGEVGQLRSQREERRRDRERDHREEDRLHAQA